GRLRRAEPPAVFGLSNGDVAGREIGQNSSSGQRGVGARRDRSPDILANLNVELESLEVWRCENQVVAERDRSSEEPDLASGRVPPRAELALLIKLPIIGQIRFWNNSKQLPAINRGGAIEQFAIETKRRTRQQNRRQQFALLNQTA